MSGGAIKPQIVNGICVIARIIIAITTLAILIGGLTLLHFPSRGNQRFFASRHPYVVGPILLIMAAGIIIPTINQWRRALPGILGYSALGGFVAIVTGHLPNATIRISAVNAMILTACLIGSAALSMTFGRRDLTLLDRFALVIFVFCMADGAITQPPVMFIALVISLFFLLLAWAVNRLHGGRREGWQTLHS